MLLLHSCKPIRSTGHAAVQGVDHKIRYQTLHDNKYIRYFGGHSEQVTGLCLSPKNDMFLSAGQVRQPFSASVAPC